LVRNYRASKVLNRPGSENQTIKMVLVDEEIKKSCAKWRN
jgi:hypothetical protein